MMKNALGSLMQQAQKMQEEFQKMQQDLAALEVQGESGAGLVRIVMTGKREVKRVSIDDSLLGDDKDMLEDLIAAAVNDAVNKVTTLKQEKMSALTAGLPLPSMFFSQ